MTKSQKSKGRGQGLMLTHPQARLLEDYILAQWEDNIAKNFPRKSEFAVKASSFMNLAITDNHISSALKAINKEWPRNPRAIRDSATKNRSRNLARLVTKIADELQIAVPTEIRDWGIGRPTREDPNEEEAEENPET